MFSRLSTAPSSGKEDVAVCWVTGAGIYTKEVRDKAILARDAALGKKIDRSSSHPVPDKITKEMKGGTAWERSLKTKFEDGNGRCYPFGCTFQKPRALYSPCAAGKLTVADDATLKMRSDLTEVVLEMAMMSLKQGPQEIVDAIHVNHELFNTPRVGHPENFAFTSNQLNLAHMRKWDSTESLAANMGEQFGGAHIDQLDSPGHYTNMIALSDLPEEADPGRFYIVYPGIFCTLANFVSVNFSGLRVHGGSPPIATKTTLAEALDWAARCTIVSYAKIGPTSSEHKMPLLQLDHDPDNILSITPEMLRPEKFFLDKKKDATNFIVEGLTVMKPLSLMTFLTRCFLILMLSLVSQLPSQMDVQIDSDSFLNSFSYMDTDGVRRRVAPWFDGPGWRSQTRTSVLESQEDRVAQLRNTWSEHQKKYGGHIPSAVCCLPDIAPLHGWPENVPLVKMKPLLFADAKGKKVEYDPYDEKDTHPSASLNKSKKGKGRHAANRKSKKTRSTEEEEKHSSAFDPESEDETVPAYAMRNAPNAVAVRDKPCKQSHVQSTSMVTAVCSVGRRSSSANTDLESSSVSSMLNALVEDAGSSPSPEAIAHQQEDIPYTGQSIPSDDDHTGPPNLLVIPHIKRESRSAVHLLGKRARTSDNDLSDNADEDGGAPYLRRDGKRVHLSKQQQNTLSQDLDDDFTPDLGRIHRQSVMNEMPELELCGSGLSNLQIYMIDCKPIIPPSQGSLSQNTRNMGPVQDFLSPDNGPSVSDIDNIRELPMYLHGLTSAVIHKELQRVRKDVTALAMQRKGMDPDQAFESVAKYQQAVHDNPLSTDSATAIQNTWNSLEYLEIMTSKATLRTRRFRSCIMTIQAASWNWLLTTIPAAISSIFGSEDGMACPWLFNLMQAIRVHALASASDVRFFPFHYNLVGITTTRPAVLGFHNFDIPDEDDSDAWIDFLTTSVQDILKVWLNFPVDGNSMWQGLFAINIIQTLGPEFLLLEVVWNKYVSATYRMMASTLLPEKLDISRYPLLDPNSSLRQNVCRISQVVDDYSAGRLYRYVDILSQDGSTFNYASEALKLESEERIVEFKLFMQDCFRKLFRGETIDNTTLGDLLKNDQDRYSPFRERAPTRLHMCRPDGPFSRQYLRTIAGLFGGVLCRGVTFGTWFSRNGPTVFHSLEDFQQAIAGIKDKSVYCDPNAYGTANGLRSSNLAGPFWNAIHNNPWPGLQKGVVLAFDDMYQYFYPRPSNPRFLGLGPLGSYLLTVDYAYAGLVTFPTPEEMGRIVFRLNKGPARTLAYLGFVSSDLAETRSRKCQQREDDFASAFVLANKLVEDSLPSVYHKEAGLDVFVTEHSLCKFGRARTHGAGSD